MTGAARVEVVRAALDRVVDPCSNAMGQPLGLDAMGLVASVEITPDRVAVRLRVTSPCCAYGESMAAAAAVELRDALGVDGVAVEVRLDPTAHWDETLVRPDTAAALARWRRRTIELTGVRPHDWSTWKESP